MRCLTIAFLTGITATAGVAWMEDTAHACGGCFVPPNEVTAVDSHRMVIALGAEETVLWDQIVYSGDPAEFVWVLPVPSPDVVIETSNNEFFNELDTRTAPSISPANAPPFCASAQSAACGAADAASDVPFQPQDGVTVFDHGVVGPYETVTLGAEDPDNLYNWLDGNGFAITQDAVPAMEHYIGLQYAFVILRLAPGEDADAMEPVRVRYPGFMGNFPLKMVVVGAQGVLDLAVWVIAEQRYDSQNYPTLLIPQDELAWDWDTSTSNYSELFDNAVERDGLSRAWVTEFAGNFNDLFIPNSTETAADLEIIQGNVPVPYITRLRTRMLVDNIDEDMILGPSEYTGDLSNFLTAFVDVNYPEIDCNNQAGDDDSVYCRLGAGSGRDAAFLGLVMILGLLAVFRTRSFRRREED